MKERDKSLEFTPTWVVASVCSVIVVVSLVVERLLHRLGKLLRKKNQKPLFEALQKIKEELMLLGFISLLLTVSHGLIAKICLSKHLADTWLPCQEDESQILRAIDHLDTSLYSSVGLRPLLGRHLLGEGEESGSETNHCQKKGKVPLLSETALEHLHIFVFVLAVSHVTFCALTVLFGGIKIRKWRKWEEAAKEERYDVEAVFKRKFTHVHDHAFIKHRFLGIGKTDAFLGWLQAFVKQFTGSVNEADYTTLRLGFIVNHCRSNPKFNFHSYVTRAFEADFKKVVGIRWCLWVFVVFFMLANVHGLHAYFWISFIPLIILLAVGTKLQHIMTELAHDVASRHMAIEGDLVVNPSDEHFWFKRPKLILLLIHIILFQNSFEIAVFFWIWVQYGSNSCIMGRFAFIAPRLIIGIVVQFLCSYSILPLYAIVSQMGSSFKKAIFREHVQEGLIHWAKKAKKKVDKDSTSSPLSRSLSQIGSMSTVRFVPFSFKSSKNPSPNASPPR